MSGGKLPIILAIDPGSEQSAYVLWDGKSILSMAIYPNHTLLDLLQDWPLKSEKFLVVEQVASYGMAVGKTIFDTVFWSGRFCEAWLNAGTGFHSLPRKAVKMHLCHSMRAKDSNIRQSLIDRFGAPGTKKAPGLTYGLKKDLWQAFALAVTYYDQRHSKSGT